MNDQVYYNFRSAVRRFKPKWIRSSFITKSRILMDSLFSSAAKVKTHDQTTVISFTKGMFSGQDLIFPKSAGNLSWVPIEVLGYYSVNPNAVGEGSLVYDGGAWPGDFTVLTSRLVGKRGRIVAFEPDPRNLESLRETLRLNDCNNVDVLDVALSDSNQLEIFSQEGVSSRLIRNGEPNDGELIKVHTASIDSLVGKYGVPELIKLDVEGEEIRILDGARETISKHRPSWAIASYHVINGSGQTYKELERILSKKYNDVTTSYLAHKTTFAFNKSS